MLITHMLPLLLAAQLASQPVDCSLLTPQQARGLNCAASPAVAPPLYALPARCNPLPNPYADPDGAQWCADWDRAHRQQVPAPPPNADGFHVGHTYRRTATGTRIWIVSLGRDMNGFFVYTGQCLDERHEDHCYAVGWPRLLYAHWSTSGWEDLGPYPNVDIR